MTRQNLYNTNVIKSYVGENDGERLRAVRAQVSAFVAEHGDMALERLDAEEASYARIVEAASSLPFLVPNKLVVVQSGSLNKDFTEHFEEFCAENVAETNDVLIVEGKLDKRTAYYKQLQKLTDFHEYKELDANGLVQWMVDYAKAQGGSLAVADARYLMQRVGDAAHAEKRTGADQLLVQHEIDKLLLWDARITKDSIDLLTDENPAGRIFDLLDAAFAGNVAQTLRLYQDQRAQGVEPQQIMAMLVWQLYIFAVVKTGQGSSAADIARNARISPFVAEKARAAMRRITLARLRTMVRELRVLDVRSKTEGIVLDEALQHYLLSLAD